VRKRQTESLIAAVVIALLFAGLVLLARW